jgi:hypothetical protein
LSFVPSESSSRSDASRPPLCVCVCPPFTSARPFGRPGERRLEVKEEGEDEWEAYTPGPKA